MCVCVCIHSAPTADRLAACDAILSQHPRCSLAATAALDITPAADLRPRLEAYMVPRLRKGAPLLPQRVRTRL